MYRTSTGTRLPLPARCAAMPWRHAELTGAPQGISSAAPENQRHLCWAGPPQLPGCEAFGVARWSGKGSSCCRGHHERAADILHRDRVMTVALRRGHCKRRLNANDSLVKFLGNSLAPFQTVFFVLGCCRGAVAGHAVAGQTVFQNQRLWTHGARRALLAAGIGLWCVGLSMLPWAFCVVINNRMPFSNLLFWRIPWERSGERTLDREHRWFHWVRDRLQPDCRDVQP